MIIVKNLVQKKANLQLVDRDTVHLDWESRQKSRQRLKTEAGREIGLALPTGTILSPGDILHRDSQVEIVVAGIPEKVFVLCPDTREAFGLMCYQIGNLHQPVGFDGDTVLIPYESVLEKQLQRLGFSYSVDERVFTHADRRNTHSHVH